MTQPKFSDPLPPLPWRIITTGALPHFGIIFCLKVNKHWKKNLKISTILKLHSYARCVIASYDTLWLLLLQGLCELKRPCLMMNVATYNVIRCKYNYWWYFIIHFSPLFPFLILFVLSNIHS